MPSAEALLGARGAYALRPVWATPFPAPSDRGTRTASAGSPLTGGEFFAEPHRGVALCGARKRALTPRGRIRGMDTYGFHPSYESPRFLLASAYQRTETIKERQRIFTTVGADQCVRPFLYLYAMPDSLLLHISATLRRRDMTVSRNSLVWWLRTAPANLTIGTISPVGCDDLGAPLAVCLHLV